MPNHFENKVALYYKDANRDEKYTFKEMMEESNRAGNVLRRYGNVEKGTAFYFHAAFAGALLYYARRN